MFHGESAISTDPLRDDLNDMCFSKYLLEDDDGPGDPESEYVMKIDIRSHRLMCFISSDGRRRLTTRVILIDFDSSEDRDPGSWSPGGPTARTVRYTRAGYVGKD
jgi:hypothetical protein